jgi:tight adherence protein C
MTLPVSHLELRFPPLGLLFWLLLFGVSAYVVLTHQPLGRPKPDLEERFRRLDVESRLRDDAARPRRRLAGSGGRETWTASLLADLGDAAQRALNGLGIAGAEALEQRLAIARPDLDIGQWYGEKVALGVVWVLFVIGAGLLGVRPFGSLPVGLWLLAFLGGYFLPDVLLGRTMRARRAQVLMELSPLLDRLALAVSAGLGLEQALLEVVEDEPGLVAEQLRQVTRDVRLGRRTLVEAFDAVAEHTVIPELGRLVGHLRTAHVQGLSMSESLAAQADATREQKRLWILETGGKATITMLLPVAVCILPVLFIIVLVPAGVELLHLGG